MDLKDYERAKFDLADIIRAAQPLAGGAARDRLQQLLVKIAEDRFNLVFAGRFSRGKSSLMNAILRTDRLPMGIEPLTSVITTVGYGSREEARVRYRGSHLECEVPLAALPDYLTQRGNPGNARGVELADVRLPAEILRRGFRFVDTPGLGSPVEENSRTTEEFLPEADALVLVTSYDGPLSAEELRALRAAAGAGRRAFVVLNKHDLAAPPEREGVVRYVRELLARELGRDAPQMFSVSAREALAAQSAGDAARLSGSGVPQFAAELTRFLLEEKSDRLLARLRERLADQLGALPQSPGTRSLLERFAATDAGSQRGAAPEDPAPPWSRGCEICARVVDASFDFLSRFQYDLSVSRAEQEAHARRGGLCAVHTWHYESLASTHGLCTGYPALVERWAQQLHALAGSGASPARIAENIGAVLPGSEDCTLCRICAQAEAQAAGELAQRLERHAHAVGASLSLVCLPHLRSLLPRVRDPGVARAVLTHEALVLERLAEDMRRYAIKHEAVRRFLASEDELAAARRALAALAGHRHACVPRRAA